MGPTGTVLYRTLALGFGESGERKSRGYPGKAGCPRLPLAMNNNAMD